MFFLYRLLSIPAQALAQNQNQGRVLYVGTGVRISLAQGLSNVYLFMALSAMGFFTLLFLLGAATLTMSRGDQTKVDNGKKMMISALIGLAIVLGSYGIMRTVLYFLYEWVP